MRYSLRSIHGTSDYFQTHLWTVKFFEPTPNIQASAGNIGDVIPAQSVKEPVVEIDYEEVPVGPSFPLKIPKYVTYVGDLDIEFYDDGSKGSLLRIKNWIREWSREIHTGNAFTSIKEMVKTCEVAKYSRDSKSPILRSIYNVLPPMMDDFQGNVDPQLMVDTCTFPVVQVILKNE